MTIAIFGRLALALGIGLLIGIERGWSERERRPGSRAAGIRTYALVGLLGGIWGLLAPLSGGAALGLAAFGFALAFAFFEWREMRAIESYSATGAVAGLLTFALGAYAALGDKLAAASAAVAATFILFERRMLHAFLEKLEWTELRAALQLLVMSVVLLPVLPDRTVDPWGAINPFQIWLLTILIAAMSYGGYIAVRLAGERNGLLFAGCAGGLISSTTVTWTFARQAKTQPEAEPGYLAAILASWAVSFARIGIIVAILAPPLAFEIAPALATAFVVAAASAAFFYFRSDSDGASAALAFENPFELGVVLSFGALLAFVMLATKWLGKVFGQMGLIGLAAISGFADVDPMALSMSEATQHGMAAKYAAIVVLTAIAANTGSKCVLTFVFGRPRLAITITAVTVLGTVAALAVYSATRGLA